MKTNHLASIFRMGILALSCTAFLASCTKESDESDEPLYTLGDPKNPSPQGSRCFEILSFEVQGEEQSSNYEEIKWTFKNNGTVIARSPNQEWPGTWNVGQQDGVQIFFLNFPDAPPLLDSVAGIWIVESLSVDNIQLIKDEGGPNPDVLQFTQSDCAIISPLLQAFNTSLDTLWRIDNLILEGNNVTATYGNITFTFNSDYTAVAELFNQQRIGQWMSSQNQDGIVLTIQFQAPPVPLTVLNANWDVVSFNGNEMVLEDVDGPPDTGSYLKITMEN